MTASRPPYRAGKRALAALAAGALAVPISFGMFGSTAFATGSFPGNQTAKPPAPIDVTKACPPSQVPNAGFTDISGDFFKDAINCIAAYNVTKGETATTYGPNDPVNRGQMAAFFYRIGQQANYAWNTANGHQYTDVDNANIPAEFKTAIYALTNAGIVSGFGDGTFRPTALVTRGQMSKFIALTLSKITGQTSSPAGSNDYFSDDDGSVFEPYLNADAAIGVYVGDGVTKATPTALAARDQMAAFLVRTIEVLVEAGKITPPFSGTVPLATSVSPTTAAPGQNVTLTITGQNITGYTISGPCTSGATASNITPPANGASQTINVPVTISSTATPGSCTLTTTVTYQNGQTQSSTSTVTVNSSGTASGQTARPELVSAKILSTTTSANATPSNPAGTLVQYVFDQAVTSAAPVPADFHVYGYDDERYTPNNATIDSTNNNAVDVLYDATATSTGSGTSQDLTTAAGASTLTLATVQPGAVDGGPTSATTNPDGSAPIGNGSTSTLTAGQTAAPDLVSVSNPRQAAQAGFTAVDFTFDQAATLTSASQQTQPVTGAPTATADYTNGFDIVFAGSPSTTTGTSTTDEVTCYGPSNTTTAATTPSGGTNPGGNGSTTITVLCPDKTSANTTALTLADIARGIVQQGTVTNAAATATNPLEASDTPHTASTTPYLTGVTITPATNSSSPDSILYTFSQPVGTTFMPADFGYYNSNGAQNWCANNASPPNGAANGTPTTAGTVGCYIQRNASNNQQVLVQFPNGALATAVGGNVKTGAVTSTTTTLANNDDELAAANSNSTTITPGTVNAPQLSAVQTHAVKDSFGNVTGYGALYTFTKPIQGTGAGLNPTAGGPVGAAVYGLLHLYDSDGTEFTCDSAVYGASGTNSNVNTVDCTSFVAGPSPGGTAATNVQVQQSTLGTADYAAVKGLNNSNPNPEGAAAATHA